MEDSMESLVKYLKYFKKLHIDRSHGVAPHKPILLISILQAFQSGLINTRKIYITPELVALFKTNWNSLVATNHVCRISYPFYYLKSEKFWKLIPKTGFDNVDKMGSLVKSFANLNAAVDYALIDENLYLLALDKKTNTILLQFLLDNYFPATKDNFNNSTDYQQKLFDDIEGKILNEKPSEYKKEIKNLLLDNNEEEVYLRGSLFKREIPKIYNNTCCISGMKINATINVSMIDACHIIPFSESYDDTITNGIALCPNLHRAFDRGLIAIDDNYKVLINHNFVEAKNTVYTIQEFERKQIFLPNTQRYFPSLENIKKHRERFNF